MLSRKQLWRRCKLKKSDIESPNMNEEHKHNKTLQPNRVNFESVVKVVLVPHYLDYEKAGTIKKMWYSHDDYLDFYTKYGNIEKAGKYNSI